MIETLIVIGGVTTAALVGLFVFSRDIRRWSNRLYGLLTLSFILLMVANMFTFGEYVSPDTVLVYIRLVAVATSLVLTCLYFLIRALSAEASGRRIVHKYTPAIFVSSVVVILLNMSPLVFETASVTDDGGVSVSVSWGVILFALHAFGLLIATMIPLVRGLRKGSGQRKRQNTSIIIGIIPTLVLAPVTSFVLPVVYGLTWFVSLSPLYIVFFIVMVAYAMIRHGLFDIRAAVLRGATYVLVLASLTVVYYLLAYSVSVFILGYSVVDTVSVSPVNVILALLLAFLFQPLKRFFDRLTNSLFYKDMYRTQDFYERLNTTVRSATSLRQLINKTPELIQDTLKAEFVSLFVYKNGTSMFSGGTEKYRKLPIDDVRAFDSLRHPVHVDDSSISPQLRRILVSHRVVVAVPLYRGDESVGLLCLGERRTSNFSDRDIRVLSVASGELVVGVQNTLAIQEIRDLNATLQQRIDAATKELRRSNAQLQRLDEAKDEFISMASHQLRTPLTSIKGYISMLIEGDLGQISKEQTHVLNEAFVSSERMVRLIGDFLNVSRLQTGKFSLEKRPVDLAKLVQRELEALEANAAARSIEFVYKKPKGIPLLEIDENKIEQVIMNFADNAIYYSKDKGKITVTLKKVDDWVEFRVIDNGIGVPKEEQAQLFNKFFRATNARRARPDGTGVGIFLAKKVILEHGGTIIFESEEGKGSVFGFRLLLPKE